MYDGVLDSPIYTLEQYKQYENIFTMGITVCLVTGTGTWLQHNRVSSATYQLMITYW